MLSSVGMIYDQIRPEERMLIEAAKNKGVKLKLYNTDEIYFDITDFKTREYEKVILQRSISYFRGLHFTAFLESKGIKVINSYKVTSICGSKALTSIILAKSGIPTPKTYLAFTESASINALKKLGFPAILKPVIGSWGRLIAPLKDLDSAKAIFEMREYMYPLYQIYYLQEMIKNLSRDIRCIVVDGKAIAAIYRYPAPEDWKTNMARGGRAEPCTITGEIEELSIKAAKVVGGGILGVDMMESENGLLVHEINNTSEFKNTVQVTGVDVPGKIIDYLVSLGENDF